GAVGQWGGSGGSQVLPLRSRWSVFVYCAPAVSVSSRSASLVNSRPWLRARPMLAVATNGGTASCTQHLIRLVNEVLKKVASRRMRLFHSFCPTPASQEKLVSGLRSGLEKPGKNRSLKVGARKPEPAPPWIRVPVSLIRNESEPRSVTDLPNTSLPSTRTPAAMKRRSKKRNCCWNSPDTVSGVGPQPFVPPTSAVSPPYSMPNVLVDHVPMWKWLSHSTSRRSTLKNPGKSHTPKVIGGHVNLSGGSTNR